MGQNEKEGVAIVRKIRIRMHIIRNEAVFVDVVRFENDLKNKFIRFNDVNVRKAA